MAKRNSSGSGKRRTQEQALGELGQAQMVAFFRSLGWPCDEVASDYGEDLLVRVFEDGISTGLSFYVQVKSTDNFARYQPKASSRKQDSSDAQPAIALFYDVDVASLRHWEFSNPSVFLFVWNTTAQGGFWKPIPEAINDLDKINPSWRNAKTVRLHFPTNYNCEASGLELLRFYLLKHNPHLVDRIIGSQQVLSFPNSPDGDEALARFRHHLNYGGEITIDGSFLETSEALRRLQGPLANWETTISVHPVPTSDPIAMRLETKLASGDIHTLPLVQMYLLESTPKRLVYVNGHPATPFSPEIVATPLHVTWTHLKDESNQEWSLSTAHSRPTVRQALDTLPFFKAFVDGGEFRAIFLAQPQPDKNWSLNRGQMLPDSHPARQGGALDPDFEGWLQSLLIIEEQFGVRFHLQDWNICPQDYWAIAEVISALASGQTQQTFKKFPVGIAPKSTAEARQEAKEIVERHTQEMTWGGASWRFFESETQPLEILGQNINVGTRTTRVTGQIAVTPQELESAFARSLGGKDARFFLRNVHVITTYNQLPSLKTVT